MRFSSQNLFFSVLSLQGDPFEISQKEMETLQKRIRFITN
jgi:hypothetical protein